MSGQCGHRVVAFFAVVLGGLASAGCADDGETSAPPSPPAAHSSAPVEAPTSSPTDTATLAAQRAVAAYEVMWAAYDQAGRAPEADPEDPRLAEVADGRALDVLVEGLTSLRERGLVVDGEVVLNPEVVRLSPDTAPTEAEIEDCGDSSGWLTVDAQTGEVTDEPRGRQLVFATVRNTGGGVWKVVDFAVREVGSCG